LGEPLGRIAVQVNLRASERFMQWVSYSHQQEQITKTAYFTANSIIY